MYILRYVDGKSDCVTENIGWCSDNVKITTQQALNFTVGLLGDQCINLAVPICDTSAARACVTGLWQLAEEAKDLQAACK